MARAPFRAFVSYSHADAAVARRLQKKLESYRVPRRLRDRVSTLGVGGQVGPVFRDREDLSASEDLSAAVKDALARSQALIVICSPSGATSHWVAREIELFRALHPDRPVLCALVEGSPDDAFPEPLRRGGAEPLAADFRRAGDGWNLAFLKVVAGILAIPLDELIQREGQRRQQRVMAVTAGSVAVMLILAAMTIVALTARAEAERQRGQAEALIEYMLTDLRTELKAVGRLQVMNDVNRRAMVYYAGQEVGTLPDDSLQRRARVLGVMGEDAENGGNLPVARSRYLALYHTTEALLAKAPAAPARLFAHAQSENRLALLAINDGRLDEALERLARVRAALTATAHWGAARGDWLRLSAFAHGNSCATRLKQGISDAATRDGCRAAIDFTERLLALHPGDAAASYDLVFHYMWLAEAEIAAGRIEAARPAQQQYLALMQRLVARDPDNMLWREQQMELYVRHADLLREQGDSAAAARFRAEARAVNQRLIARDPDNAVWARYEKRLQSR
ncbi:TIR domain-containing protein [Sphingoaurantiacus capsulatus]|uniref:TIR domain-containing protein n=1 Tax=Sphingoaurantiacus capsulatus TaxID=1771310 RepID=A0ABV7X4U7_9SPHN